MSEFVIHSVPGSPYGRAVLMALEEKGAAYRFAAAKPGTLRSPEHLALHPFGKIPVLEHDGFRLYESQAILRYLDRIVPQPKLTPPDPRAAARMDQLLNINDWYLFHGVASVIGFQRIVGPRLMGLTPDESAIAAVMPKAHLVFNALAEILGDNEFFVGDTLSLADLLLASHLELLRAAPEWEVLTENAANLRRWLDGMVVRPSMAATTWGRLAELARAA
jgi:glutathione S-transferase